MLPQVTLLTARLEMDRREQENHLVGIEAEWRELEIQTAASIAEQTSIRMTGPLREIPRSLQVIRRSKKQFRLS